MALLIVALLGLPSLLYPLHADQAMFATIGDLWLHGKLPYRDAWDIKPPGIFALYALAQIAFGHSMASGHLADLLAALVTAAGLFALASRLGSPRTAAFAPLAFGIAYFTGFGYQETAQVESFAAPLTVGYLYSLCTMRDDGRARWPIAAGLCLGLLLLLKIVFVLLVILIPVFFRGWQGTEIPASTQAPASQSPYFLRPEARRAWIWFLRLLPLLRLLGAAILPLALTGAYFWWRGALEELPRLLAAQQAYGRPDDLRAAGSWASAADSNSSPIGLLS